MTATYMHKVKASKGKKPHYIWRERDVDTEQRSHQLAINFKSTTKTHYIRPVDFVNMEVDERLGKIVDWRLSLCCYYNIIHGYVQSETSGEIFVYYLTGGEKMGSF